MLSKARPVRFFVLVMVCYLVLDVLWPGAKFGYAIYFRGMLDSVFATVNTRYALVIPELAAENATDVELIVVNREAPNDQSTLPIKSRMVGFLPTVCFAALVLGTPIAWRRRLLALVVGAIVVHLFILARVWAVIAYLLSSCQPIPVWDVSPTTRRIIFSIYEMSVYPVTGLIGVVAIWALVTLRREDLQLGDDQADK